MFLNYYQLKEQPFGVTPDPRFLYLSPTHREALASLIYGVESGRGFMALVAKPGMGKTTLLFQLLEQLRSSAQTVFLFQTQCDSREFFRYLLADLGFDTRETDVVVLHKQFNEVLIREMRAGKRFVLAIDEAQNLDDSVLETVRLLSDFETPRTKLLQIILAGQPQLAEKLARPSLAQLRQRVSMLVRLNPFSVEDTARLIEHRLRVAGYNGPLLFTPEALELIAVRSEGIPRNIVNLCFNALSLGCALDRKAIDVDVLREVLSDLDVESLLPGPPAWRRGSVPIIEADLHPADKPSPDEREGTPGTGRKTIVSQIVREVLASLATDLPINSAQGEVPSPAPKGAEGAVREGAGSERAPRTGGWTQALPGEPMAATPASPGMSHKKESSASIAPPPANPKAAQAAVPPPGGGSKSVPKRAGEAEKLNPPAASEAPSAAGAHELEALEIEFVPDPAPAKDLMSVAPPHTQSPSVNVPARLDSRPFEIPETVQKISYSGSRRLPSSRAEAPRKAVGIGATRALPRKRGLRRWAAWASGVAGLTGMGLWLSVSAGVWPHLPNIARLPGELNATKAEASSTPTVTQPPVVPAAVREQSLAPAAEAPQIAPSEAITIVVEPNQTLSQICLKHLGRYDRDSLKKVQELNPGIVDPDVILISQHIRLPRSAEVSNPSRAAEKAADDAKNGPKERP